MDDLISRQAALDAINSGMLTEDDYHFECLSECNSMLEWAVNAVKELPTAEPRIGKWIPLSDGWAECSSCEHLERVGGLMCRYCPHCGARMEE